MIKSFKHKGLEDFFYDGSKKGIRPEHADKIARILVSVQGVFWMFTLQS
ncbi:antitoxin of plasmid maintenance system [Desulfosarcina variabilis str. Montpellier]